MRRDKHGIPQLLESPFRSIDSRKNIFIMLRSILKMYGQGKTIEKVKDH